MSVSVRCEICPWCQTDLKFGGGGGVLQSFFFLTAPPPPLPRLVIFKATHKKQMFGLCENA